MKHKGKLAKLGIIGDSEWIDRLDMDSLKSTIQDFDLSINITDQNGSDMLVYDSRDQWALLNLLEDNYITSQNSGLNYEVTGKRRHKQRKN